MVDIADSANVRYAIVKEVVPGETPDPATFEQINPVSDTLNPAASTINSAEINPSRQRRFNNRVSIAAEGNIETEMQAVSWNNFLAGVFNREWVARNGEANTHDVWIGNDQLSFTLEKTFDLDDADVYQRITGLVVDSFTMTIETGSAITATFGCLARKSVNTLVPATNSSYEAISGDELWDGSKHIQTFTLNNVDILSKMTSFNMTMSNNGRQQAALGTDESVGIGTGQCEISGTLVIYLSDLQQAALFEDQSVVPMVLRMGDDAEDDTAPYLEFVFPAVKLTSIDTGIPGTNNDVVATYGFEAQIGTTAINAVPLDTTLRIERLSAPDVGE